MSYIQLGSNRWVDYCLVDEGFTPSGPKITHPAGTIDQRDFIGPDGIGVRFSGQNREIIKTKRGFSVFNGEGKSVKPNLQTLEEALRV